MKIKSVTTGCMVFKSRELGFFAFEPLDKPQTTSINVLVGARWHTYDTQPPWPAIGMAGAKYPNSADWVIVANSADGDLWEVNPGNPTGQRLLRISGDYSNLTKLASIDHAVWACGMDRLVLRREEDGRWTNCSAPPASVSEGIIGFTAIAGVEPQTLVAVGWQGEIWFRSGDQWQRQDCGSNANFNAVSVGPDGQIVVVGDGGAIVVGRRDQWRIVDIDTTFNLQGVCHFGEEVFVCTDFEIYRFTGDALLAETRFETDDEPKTCMNLLAGPETVLSQGETDIFRFVQGKWARVY